MRTIRCLRLLALAGLCVGLMTTVMSGYSQEKKVATPNVKEGDALPAIELQATLIEKVLPDNKGDKLNLAAFKGKKNIVLFFYPKAMTKGCTIESCGFRDRAEAFTKLDTVIIGISTDKVEAQKQFTEKEKLNYPLLADHEGKVTKAFGIFRANSPLADRFTFVVDKAGVVKKVYAPAQTSKTMEHPEEVLKFVKENLK